MEKQEPSQEFKEFMSKFTHYYTTAGSLDNGSATVDKKFAEAIILAQPVAPLEERGVITVKDVGQNTDEVVFTVMPESDVTWRTVDTRGSEVVTAGSLQQITAPSYPTTTPVTKSFTTFIHDNQNLVNPIEFQTLALVIGNQIKKKKIVDAITELTTLANYTVGTSVKNANGFTTYGTVASDDTLTPNDLTSSKNDLKGNSTTPVVPDVCLVHTKQLNQIENNANFSPGQTTNANYKKAKFDQNGNLIEFDGMEIIELLEAEYSAITSGSFNSNNGHYAIVGRKDLMLGRGENNRKNTTEDFRDPEQHGTRRTININFDYVVLGPDYTRLLACVD